MIFGLLRCSDQKNSRKMVFYFWGFGSSLYPDKKGASRIKGLNFMTRVYL